MIPDTHNTESFEANPGIMQGQRLKFGLAAVVLAIALGYLSYMALNSATIYYLTVGEVVAQGPSEKVVRINGKLVPTSFERGKGDTLAHFSLSDGDTALQTQYNGIIPDLFFNGQSEIVAEGTYQPDNVFHASNILVKCPSKYEAVQET